MWPFPNPLDLFGEAVSGAVGWAWDKVIQGIYTWFASGVLMLMEWVWSVLDSATTPRLTEDWFASGLVEPLAALSLAITVAMMLASAVQAGFGGRPELIVDALKEGPKAIAATAVTVVVMDVLVRGADALSEAVWQTGRADAQQVLDSVAEVMSRAGVLAGTFLGPLALLFGMIGLLMTTVVLFTRSALLYLVAAFSPIVWASSVSPVMRASGRRLVHVTVALVLAKPAITITLVVGTKLLANVGTPGVGGESPDGAAALGTLVTGFSCFAIAGLSPWVVYRLLPSVEQAAVASGVVGGWGRTGMTAVQAGLMAKSLGASSAASAATRAMPAMAQGTASSVGGASSGQATGSRVTLHKDDDLFELSGGREVYAGWIVEDILAPLGDVQFQNGQTVSIGASSSASDDQQQRLLLRQAVEAHFEKELQLVQQHRRKVIPEKIKPLTLFFIEKVSDYAPSDSKLRRWFEEEYERVRALGKFRTLQMPEVSQVHDGYFAVDRKGVAKEARADSKDAADAFERIMRRKQDLLGFEEPLRFIFSHSALAEGWDNPNVFTICNLQDGKSTMRKRQQVGRGLRLPVMAANGERCHVDDINVLTVVAKESFSSFADALQREIEEETGVKFSGRIIDLRKKRELKLKDAALASAEFQTLWSKIAPQTTYRMDFSTEAVVAEAIRRIGEMPAIERVKFRITEGVIRMGSEGLTSASSHDRGEVDAEGARRMPDVVGELCRRLPISRATIVRILRECGRLDEVKVNPAVFLDQVAEAIRRAVYGQAAEGIVYRKTGETWAAELIKDRHHGETVAPRVVPVKKSITDQIVCDSEVEQAFAEYLDALEDVPLFVKLPEWFKVSTPLGNYNPDWAFVRDEAGSPRVYLVRETKGTDDIEKLQWESEGWKIKFGQAHFDAIGVDYAFGKEPAALVRPTLARVLPFAVKRDHEVDAKERYSTHLPLFSLKAAAGGFSDGQDVEPEGWVEVGGRLAADMFVAQVVGKSMEPTIPDGAYCVFQRIGAGSRQGKIVLAQHREVDDPDNGGSYTVKEYSSEYKLGDDGERRGSVTLRPRNSSFEPIVITADDEGDVSVIAAFVRVL